MKVKAPQVPSEGVCYGCRHADDERFSTTGHCRGTGHLEPGPQWGGFICTCNCVEPPPT